MKYLLIVGALVVICVMFLRKPSIPPRTETNAQSAAAAVAPVPQPASAPASTALKRPIDRTHQVLDQVEKRNGAGEF